MNMDLEQLRDRILKDLKTVGDIAELELARVRNLGRKSDLSGFLRSLKERTEDERRSLGAKANKTRKALEEKFTIQPERLTKKAHETLDRIDVSATSRK